MRILIITIGVLLSTTSLMQAQIHMGLTTAINSTFVLDKGLTEDPRYNSVMTYDFAPVGFSFGVDIGKKFGLQLESILSNQGQIFEMVDAAKEVVGKRSIDLSYIQIPMLFKFMSGKGSGARTNFSLGPQLSILQKGSEVINMDNASKLRSLMEVKDDYVKDNGDGTYAILDPSTGAVLDPAAIAGSAAGTYDMATPPTTEILSSKATDQLEKFRNTEFQIAGSFGLDIDLGKNLYLSSIIRANYSLTDMRNGDILDQLKNSGVSDILSNRANLLVGIQLGLHYVVGGNRKSRSKSKE